LIVHPTTIVRKMIHYKKHVWILSACLSGLAGFVDAIGYIQLGGFFVSFMSGNSTMLGVSSAIHMSDAFLAAGLILMFIAGVIIGTLFGNWTKSSAASLGLVTAFLAAAAVLHNLGFGRVAVVSMVLAMGAENTIFQRNGEVSIGLTYMTGTLVKLGQWVAAAISGGPKDAWIPYAILWAGLVTGAFLGAVTYAHVGMNGLWIAAFAAACCTVWAFKSDLSA
jgi:uncharacterized membrane protein YoaK (UPF0700 family)